jgi:hypothetical protein
MWFWFVADCEGFALYSWLYGSLCGAGGWVVVQWHVGFVVRGLVFSMGACSVSLG